MEHDCQSMVLNQSDVISAWATHFEELGASKVNGSSSLQLLQSIISSYKVSSSQNEDFIVDTPITVEEIEAAIAKLKRGKSCGPDGIFPEHILFGGSAYRLWLVKILNETIDFESIPRSFLNSIIVPIYKGKGRDPLLAKNYRGISLTSVIGKLFECILLQRLIPVIEELGIPHYTQTAYQAGISCADPTEVVQEAVRSHLQHAWFYCLLMLYDLEKAFDSVEYCVLLDHLYRSGINGRTWRLIKSFYNNPCGQVKIGNRLLRVITLQRGVKQGSVLSPMLFLLVMDSLLEDLANANSGISIKGIYTGSLGHADDLRSVTPNLHSLQKQAEIVKSFTVKNSLTLNVDKLDLLVMANSSQAHNCEILIGSTRVTSKNEARCLESYGPMTFHLKHQLSITLIKHVWLSLL